LPEPVQFTIKPDGHTWALARDGAFVAHYSHIEQATHDAVRHARALEETGEPAQVLVHAKDKVIEVDVSPTVTQVEELRGPDAA